MLLDPKKEYPPFALAMVLDNSWSMNEALSSTVGKIDLAKEIAIAAMEGLNKGDWLTLVSFDSDYHDIIAPTKVKDLEPAKYEVSRIGAFGMTNILGGLTEAARILRRSMPPTSTSCSSATARRRRSAPTTASCWPRWSGCTSRSRRSAWGARTPS